ncbi:MAG: hypothetical protein HRU38_22270 [Saccharospirillaceae bacterium]|nr:hypothetical protein [Pseudomonadales bacterium]NRB81355.1 hypothetical protein [Saccharospirillaceae bacterium]
MSSFETAIEVANSNIKKLIPNSCNVSIEGILISDDKKLYEVSLSYDIKGNDPLEVKEGQDLKLGQGIAQLVKVMSYRRNYKTFLIDYKTSEFRGFRNDK